MGSPDVTRQLLREHLLDGVSMLLASAAYEAGAAREADAAQIAPVVREACSALGARVAECTPAAGADAGYDEAEIEATVARALETLGEIDVLVVEAAGLYAARGAGLRDALVGSLESSWNVSRALANQAFISRERPGLILYIAPVPGAGLHADAARAGLENLARTLSIEWSRYCVRTVAVAPGESTGAHQLAQLIAYLASPAGGYFSGCMLDLRGAQPSRA